MKRILQIHRIQIRISRSAQSRQEVNLASYHYHKALPKCKSSLQAIWAVTLQISYSPPPEKNPKCSREGCRERDRPCPFVMLPPELTIYIFEMTILPLAPHLLHHHPDHFHRPHRQLAVLSLVCRCWYHLANGRFPKILVLSFADHKHHLCQRILSFSLSCRCLSCIITDTSLFHSLDTSQYPNITVEQVTQICNRRPLLQSLRYHPLNAFILFLFVFL